MLEVFLSASVPLPTRDREFFETADVLAIRESVKSLVEVVLPVGRITTGGHPAITPLLAHFRRAMGLTSDHVTIYQSEIFRDVTPVENDDFRDVRFVSKVGNDRAKSLTKMRREMIGSRKFDAAVFSGGMDGILEEAKIFRELHPRAIMLPLASTGAAAAVVFRDGEYPTDFLTNRTYSSLFRRQILQRR